MHPGRAAVHALVASLVFLVVYGGTSYLTSLRSDVGTWYYAWERHIPFVPWMIVPYMSIDVFFVLAPFLCRGRAELRTLTRRLVATVVLGGIVFLIYPLQLAVERPTATGWAGVIYNSFTAIDRPYNLLPSLHIALRTVLAAHYHRHTPRRWRWALHLWFFLIGLSTLLVWQHHVIDVVGGFILGFVVLWAIDVRPLRLPHIGNARVAGLYAAGAGLCVLAIAVWPVLGWVMLWPSAALAMVALGYVVLGPGVYRKQDGRLAFAARVVLAPVLLGQAWSRRHYAKACDPWNAVAPGVWIGRVLDSEEAERAVASGVTAVLDLSVAFDEAEPFLDGRVAYLHLPVLDLTAPTPAQREAAIAFIEEHAGAGVVYVHCKIGYSRSVAVVGAWLLATGRDGTVDAAIETIRRVRPAVVVRLEVRAFLHEAATATLSEATP
ncbi:MAG: dual specificity protein phosphatase family protein [Planctomycetota bacterium]